MPTAADWQNRPTAPLRGIGPGVAFKLVPTWVLISPSASGPSGSDTVRASEVDQRQAVRRLDLAAGEQDDAVGTFVRCLDHDVAELVASHEDEREIDLSVHRCDGLSRLDPADRTHRRRATA